MDKTKINELLYNKSELLQKRLSRMYLFLFVFPLIYFLLDNSFISEVKTPLISINKVKIILLTFPIIYVSLMLLIVIVSIRLTAIQVEMENPSNQNPNLSKEVKKLLSPIMVVTEFSDNLKLKGLLGCFSLLVFYVPIFLFTIILPFTFLGYTICYNFNYEGEFKQIASWSAMIGLWLFLTTLFKIYILLKKYKEKNS